MLVTLTVLFCGLLFFVNLFPSDGFRLFIQYFAIICMIGATVIVILMILWDANTRKKKEGKRRKREKKQIEAQIQELRQQGLPFDHLIHVQRTSYDKVTGSVIFKAPFYEDDDKESDEEAPTSLNQLLEDLFSAKRLYRKLFLVNRKRKRIQTAVTKNASKAAEAVKRQTQNLRKSLVANSVHQPIVIPNDEANQAAPDSPQQATTHDKSKRLARLSSFKAVTDANSDNNTTM